MLGKVFHKLCRWLLVLVLMTGAVQADSWRIVSSTPQPWLCASNTPTLYYSLHTYQYQALNTCGELALKNRDRHYFVRDYSISLIEVVEEGSVCPPPVICPDCPPPPECPVIPPATTSMLRWIPPTENEDGSELTDLVKYRFISDDDPGISITLKDPNAVELEVPNNRCYRGIAVNSEDTASEKSNEVCLAAE